MGLTILPEGLTVDVAPGVSVLEACREHDIDLPGICGGRGRCRECRVTVIDRVVAPSALEQSLLEPDDIARGWRLSCQRMRTRRQSLIITLSAPPGGDSLAIIADQSP